MAGFDCTNESLVLDLVALLPISASSLVVITDIQNALLTPVDPQVILCLVLKRLVLGLNNIKDATLRV